MTFWLGNFSAYIFFSFSLAVKGNFQETVQQPQGISSEIEIEFLCAFNQVDLTFVFVLGQNLHNLISFFMIIGFHFRYITIENALFSYFDEKKKQKSNILCIGSEKVEIGQSVKQENGIRNVFWILIANYFQTLLHTIQLIK